MVQSCEDVFYRIEKEKFLEKIQKIQEQRQKVKIKNLAKVNKPKFGASPTTAGSISPQFKLSTLPSQEDLDLYNCYKDRRQKLKQLADNSIFNAEAFLDLSKIRKNPKKRKKKKNLKPGREAAPVKKRHKKTASKSQYFMLQAYINNKRAHLKKLKTTPIQDIWNRPRFSTAKSPRYKKFMEWDTSSNKKARVELKKKLRRTFKEGEWGNAQERLWDDNGYRVRGLSEKMRSKPAFVIKKGVNLTKATYFHRGGSLGGFGPKKRLTEFRQERDQLIAEILQKKLAQNCIYH